MADPAPADSRPAHRRPADHRRLRAAARASSCGTAPQVVPRAEHVHDLPHDAAAADPARARPDLRHRRRRDRPLLPVDHRLLRLRLRGALQGIRPRLDRRHRGDRLRRAGRLRQRHADRQGRHPLLHRDARHAVLLGRHGGGAFGRQVLCAARRRSDRRSGRCIVGRPFAEPGSFGWVGPALGPAALDRGDLSSSCGSS